MHALLQERSIEAQTLGHLMNVVVVAAVQAISYTHMPVYRTRASAGPLSGSRSTWE